MTPTRMRSGISCTQKSSWGSTPNAKETRASAHRRPPRILGTSDSPAPCAPQNRDATILLQATPSPWILPGMTKWTRSPQALTAPESRPILPMPKHTRGPDQTRRNALVPCSHYQRFPPWQPRRESCLHARVQEGLAVVHQGSPLGPCTARSWNPTSCPLGMGIAHWNDRAPLNRVRLAPSGGDEDQLTSLDFRPEKKNNRVSVRVEGISDAPG